MSWHNPRESQWRWLGVALCIAWVALARVVARSRTPLGGRAPRENQKLDGLSEGEGVALGS